MAEYIEREAAIDAVFKLTPKVDDDGYCWVIRGDVATAIDSIPAADVRPVVRGVWKFDDFDGDGLDYQCSVCKLFSRQNYDFCPNCGAMMEEN